MSAFGVTMEAARRGRLAMQEWVSQIAEAVDLINEAIEAAHKRGDPDIARRLGDATVKLGCVAAAIAVFDSEPAEGRGFGPQSC
jgi:hypothetical protein